MTGCSLVYFSVLLKLNLDAPNCKQALIAKTLHFDHTTHGQFAVN